jgi:hypothetical protein
MSEFRPLYPAPFAAREKTRTANASQHEWPALGIIFRSVDQYFRLSSRPADRYSVAYQYDFMTASSLVCRSARFFPILSCEDLLRERWGEVCTSRHANKPIRRRRKPRYLISPSMRRARTSLLWTSEPTTFPWPQRLIVAPRLRELIDSPTLRSAVVDTITGAQYMPSSVTTAIRRPSQLELCGPRRELSDRAQQYTFEERFTTTVYNTTGSEAGDLRLPQNTSNEDSKVVRSQQFSRETLT